MTDEFVLYIEIRGLYDGWSVGVKPDGSLHNRWDKDDYRYARTQKFIDSYPGRYEWKREDTGDRPLFRSSRINEQKAESTTEDGGLQPI